MPDTEYGYALKQARKRYQDALAKGEYPICRYWTIYWQIRILYPP